MPSRYLLRFPSACFSARRLVIAYSFLAVRRESEADVADISRVMPPFRVDYSARDAAVVRRVEAVVLMTVLAINSCRSATDRTAISCCASFGSTAMSIGAVRVRPFAGNARLAPATTGPDAPTVFVAVYY